jgi:hypothetical protein
MIQKVYEVDPLVCPRCSGQMKVISFLTDYAVVDRIINHLNLTFVADRPPPPHIAYQTIIPTAAGLDIPRGKTYFWRVTAVLANGREIKSRLAKFFLK